MARHLWTNWAVGRSVTALKASVGRYVNGQSVEIAERNNPIFTSVNSASRTWNDTNGNYVPDCNLADFAANGECLPINSSGVRIDATNWTCG